MTSAGATVFDHIRRMAMLPCGAGLSDEQLLNQFIDRQDHIAFEMLVRRHGPMVQGVCQRLLGNAADADDAFQATFLVLVRKAHTVVPRAKVGNWLYGVAYRAALKARARAARRRRWETQLPSLPDAAAPIADKSWRDLQPLLDREISHLAEKYRAPIVLCDLERKTHKEAARQLGWPEGTLSVRLMRARKMLARRLTQRGVTLTAGSLALVLSQNVASARVPLALVNATVKAAGLIAADQAAALGVSVAALTQGVLKAMVMTKIKAVVGVMAVGFALVGGGGLIAYQTTAGANGLPEQGAAAGGNLNTGQSKLPAAAAKTKTDEELLQGDWIMVDGENKGEKLELAGVPKTFLKISFAGDRIIFPEIILEQPGDITFKVDATKNPRQLTKIFKSGDKSISVTEIYAVSGDELKTCVAGAELPAPTDFTAKRGAGQLLLVYRRDRPDAARDKEQLQGMWQIVTGEMDDMPLFTNDPEGDERRLVVFEGDKVSGIIFNPKGRYLAKSILGMWTIGPPENAGPKLEESKFTFTLDPSKKPSAINFLQGEKWNEAAIYHLEDDHLKIGFSLPGPRMGDRPAGFVGQGTGFIILKRRGK